MSTLSSCPSSERLRQLLDDRLPPEEQADLTAHLGSCPRCQRELDALATGGPFPPGPTLHLAAPPVEATLVQVLENLRSNPGAAIARRPGPRENWVLSFLAPPSGPGMLGRLGDYDVLEVVGQGGMGIVLKAFDPALRREVAIKVLAPHLASDASARARFAREGRSAAAVHHENVVTIHAVDEAAGLPFLVMEYVAGGSLQNYLDRYGPLSVLGVVRVGAQAAAGLAAAHAKGLIHRDIKPANLLLAGPTSPTLADCKVKITDFGLARAADESTLTQSGTVAGTPMYMAPEQALGEEVGPKADLFSLGSTLYALCTGRPPFPTGTPMAVLRRVCDTTPSPIHQINPAVPFWLIEVILSLQARPPQERFPSAAELAELMRQHLAHLEEPDRVPRPADRPRLRRKRRRPRLPLVLGGVVVVALLALGLGLLWRNWSRPAPRLMFGGQDGPLWSLAFSPDGQMLATGGNEGAVRLWSPEDGQAITELKGHKLPVLSLAFNRAGDMLATGTTGDNVRLWQPRTHAPLSTIRHPGTRALTFSPDGKVLAATAGSKVDLLSTASGKVLRSLPHHYTVLALAYAPDGQALVSADARGNLKVWAGREGHAWNERTAITGHNSSVYALAFSSDGRTMASGSADQTVKLWDTVTWQERGTLKGHDNGVLTVAFAPSGGTLASGSRDGSVKLWDVAAQKELATFGRHHSPIRSIAISPDGRSLASAGEDKIVRIWDVARYTRAEP
jgi:serine/threonine protein kinase